MPTAHKVGWSKLRVGILATVALIILGVLIVLLTGTKKLWATRDTVYTYMNDTVGLAKGSPVRLNGILVGAVKKIELSGETTPQRIIRIVLEIDHEMMAEIPVDSTAGLAAENVLGTKFINIKKGKASVSIQPGAEVKAFDSADFDEIMQQSYNLLASVQGIIKRVDAIVSLIESGKGSIGKLLVDEELYNRVLAITGEFQQISHALTTPKGTIGKLLYDDALYQDFRGTMGRVDAMVADLQSGQGSAGKFLKDDKLYTEMHTTVRELRRLIEDLNAGKGTAGKLLKEDDLHNQLRASLTKVDGIIDRINSGQGTVGQLLVNPQLYDTMNGATAELQQLLKAIRQNPKQYLRIKLALF